MNAESIPQRIERIMHEQNVGFKQAAHIAFAESRIEKRVAEVRQHDRTR